jgi:hypothetical protein
MNHRDNEKNYSRKLENRILALLSSPLVEMETGPFCRIVLPSCAEETGGLRDDASQLGQLFTSLLQMGERTPSPDKSDYRTNPFLVLDLSRKRVNQELPYGAP